MCECFHCCSKSIMWDGDFSFEDYCEEGEGIVHEYHCINCGARIIYKVRTSGKENNTTVKQKEKNVGTKDEKWWVRVWKDRENLLRERKKNE